LIRRVVAVFGPQEPLKPLLRAISGEASQIHGDDLVGGF
jgi:hypothetical protein